MIQNLKIKTIFAGTSLIAVGFFWLVFSSRFVLPQILQIGRFRVHYYGLIMAGAVLCGWHLAKKTSGKYGISLQKADDLIFWLIVAGLLGARLYHVISSINYYIAYPAEILKVWQGGLSIYGALIGGAVAVWFFAKRYSLNVTYLLNWLTPAFILGQIIGRLGNLFNYEAFGYPTNLPWKMFVPVAFRPVGYLSPEYFHPWFLYEQIGLIIIFLIIKKITQRQPLKAPANDYLFVYYLLLYNALRFGLEFLRIDATFIGNFRLNSLVSLVLVFFASGYLVRIHNAEIS